MAHHFTFQKITSNHQLPFRLLVHDTGAAHVVLRHWHQSYEISYVVAGTIPNYYLNGQTLRQRAHEVVVVNPYQVHGLTLPTDSTRTAMTLMLPLAVLDLAGLSPETYQFQNHISAAQSQATGLDQLLIDLFQTTIGPHQNGVITRQIGLLYLILSTLITHFVSPTLPALPPISAKKVAYVQRVLDWLTDHYMQAITVTDMAAIAQISPSYFAHLFQQQLQQSPMTYLENLRALHTQQLLTNTSLAIPLISDRVGFPNTKACTVAFKRLYHQTPHHYRMSLQK